MARRRPRTPISNVRTQKRFSQKLFCQVRPGIPCKDVCKCIDSEHIYGCRNGVLTVDHVLTKLTVSRRSEVRLSIAPGILARGVADCRRRTLNAKSLHAVQSVGLGSCNMTSTTPTTPRCRLHQLNLRKCVLVRHLSWPDQKQSGNAGNSTFPREWCDHIDPAASRKAALSKMPAARKRRAEPRGGTKGPCRVVSPHAT